MLLDPWYYMDDSLKVMDITYLFTEVSKTIAAVKKFHGTWWKKANLYQPKLFSKVFSVCRNLSVSIKFPYHRSPPSESSSMWGRRNWFGSTKFTDKFTWKHTDPAVTNVFNKCNASSQCSKELSWQGDAAIKAGIEGFCEWELYRCPDPLWYEPPGGRRVRNREGKTFRNDPQMG